MTKNELRSCPVCGHESWPIVFGMIPPSAREEFPRETIFGGCAIFPEERENPVTGELEYGMAEWKCQNDECRHGWW